MRPVGRRLSRLRLARMAAAMADVCDASSQSAHAHAEIEHQRARELHSTDPITTASYSIKGYKRDM